MRNTVLSILSLLALTLAFAPTDADAGKDALRLRAEAGTERVVAGQPFVIESTFSNAGTADLEVFVPEHVGAVPFPAWTFVSQDGDTYIPHIPSFQSMWKVGLQGEVMKLAPGASRSFSLRVSSVVKKVDEKTTGWGDAVPLPPGRYTVTCRYTKEDAKVPYGADSMRMERVLKTHEGLFTGTVAADPLTLQVVASDEPALEIEAPEAVATGAAYPLRLRLRNDGAKRIELVGAFEVTIGHKASTRGDARFVFQDGRFHAAKRGHVQAMALEPGGSIEGVIDLSAQTFLAHWKGKSKPMGFYDVLHTGTFHLGVRLLDDEGEAVAAVSRFRKVRPLDEDTASGLRVRLEHAKKEGGRHVTVVLENAGTKALRVPASLAYPKHVYFSLVRPGSEDAVYRTTRAGGVSQLSPDEPGSDAKIATGLSWDGDAAEHAKVETIDTYALLQPGSEIRRTIDIDEIVTPSLQGVHGVFELRAIYRNREPGRRYGVDGAFVGRIASEPLEIRGGAW